MIKVVRLSVMVAAGFTVAAVLISIFMFPGIELQHASVAPPNPSGLLIGFMLLAVACFTFWVYQLVDCLVNEADTGNNKIAWVVVIIFLNLLGALLYWIFRKPHRRRELGR